VLIVTYLSIPQPATLERLSFHFQFQELHRDHALSSITSTMQFSAILIASLLSLATLSTAFPNQIEARHAALRARYAEAEAVAAAAAVANAYPEPFALALADAARGRSGSSSSSSSSSSGGSSRGSSPMRHVITCVDHPVLGDMCSAHCECNSSGQVVCHNAAHGCQSACHC